MRQRIAMILIAAGLFIFNIGSANAFVVGWNLVRVSSCVGFQISGVDYLFVYPITGGVISTIDPTTIAAAAQFCANGNAFYIYFDGANWNGVLLYPGLR